MLFVQRDRTPDLRAAVPVRHCPSVTPSLNQNRRQALPPLANITFPALYALCFAPMISNLKSEPAPTDPPFSPYDQRYTTLPPWHPRRRLGHTAHASMASPASHESGRRPTASRCPQLDRGRKTPHLGSGRAASLIQAASRSIARTGAGTTPASQVSGR